ncbi:Para-hydroxybenzoic acid efflux pump subunit AaeB/fusaric acid resistance protein [Macleaya cordata]|uniref:Para-hydroxybenzoic acid efflux pump subunit AaeB/fusaric acid resistance protein n=1 Tax=Macleaya cordata TaxID=56857 RepID=A0A200R6L7_MACCD|nr:Para-hydroxybenzoic acid efflux pump subunit AaeB/fusaric acid resistance protein [Macleaya cordata]
MSTIITLVESATTTTEPAATATTTKTISRTRAVWHPRIASAFRTALACTIVGFITLFSPVVLQREVAFPALSYVTVILIVSEASLGDTIRGCWHVLYATFQGVLPAILSLWLIGPARYSISASVVAVTLMSFVITLPESTHLICKRIALAQIVILYSVTSVEGVHTGVITHPVHVAASAGVGGLAALFALVFPYPRLASYEVRKKSMLFKENISERLNLFVNAFCAENKTSALASISQAKSLVKTGTTLFQNIKIKQESMQWERPLNRLAKQYDMNPTDRLQALEIPLKGIEIALTSCSSFPVRVADQELKNLLLSLKEQINITLKQTKSSPPSDSSTVPETAKEEEEEVLHELFLQTLQTNFPTQSDLPSFFFLFCMKLLHDESIATRSDRTASKNNPTPKIEESVQKQDQYIKKSVLSSWILTRIITTRLMYAAKCSLSLGLAVLFGMMFSKENGFWAGLTVGVGMAGGREATFKIANIKAQGTVLGTIYGVLACFLFPRFVEIRFLSLLPWIIFTSFLRRSRMYDQAGAISAIIAALIILGRKDYGPPSEFAIVRITEAFIGLTCSIMVELLLQPTRASTMAKVQLSKSLRALHDYIGSIDVPANRKNNSKMCLTELKEKEKKLRVNVSELGKFIAEAGVEPNFWFIPFHGACYSKLLGSLSKMVDLLLFATHAMGFLAQESHRFGVAWIELQEQIGGDLDHFKEMVVSSLKCFEEVTLIKSLANLEKELKSKNISYDLELGKSNANGLRVLISEDEDEMEKIMSSFVQHSREVVDKVDVYEGDEEELKSQMVLCLSAIGFCIDALMKETREIEKNVKELVQWENPSSHVNLCEIYCKINALYT